MNDRLNLSAMLSGYVRVWNDAGDVVEGKNLVVYTGGDIIAQLLAGNCEYRISHFYFGYENTVGAPVAPAAARTDTVSYFSSMAPPQDYLRAAILEPPVLSASDVNHNSNVATFNSVATATIGENGLAFGPANDSKVFTVGMVAAPTGAVGGDVLYARYVLPVPLPAAGSGQVSATWATEAN